MRHGAASPQISKLLRFVMLAGLVTVAFAACGDDDKTGKCASDNECTFGLVCQAEACTPLPCNGIADCTNGGQACVAVNDGQFCAAVECGCADCDLCPLGEVCSDGMCELAAACSDVVPCTGSDVCDEGSCRQCAGAECPADCTVAGCTGGLTCNTTTKVCEGGGAAEACSACARSADCGEGWKCVPLLSGNACLPPCSDKSDCPSGWDCQAQACTPESYKCTGCTIDGCPGGESCNPADNACVTTVASCGTCTADWQCGEGNACAGGECAPKCNAGTCSAGGACGTSVDGASVCTEACASACTPACGGATPICSGGACVQCANSNDCSPGQTCDTGTGLCTGEANCTSPTPYAFQNSCVECLTNAHCGARFCDQNTKTCGDDACAGCADPYPACIEYEGQQYCVQCETNADCVAVRGEGSTCNTSTYACEGGAVNTGPKCVQDSDCNAGGSGFSLRCNASSGYCYDASGGCDDITAYCSSSGTLQPCVSFFELAGAGQGGQLPDLGQGMTIPGFCGCSASNPCPGGVECNTFIGCISCLSDPDPITCGITCALSGGGVCL